MSKEHNPFDSHLSYALAAAHRMVSQSLNARLKKHSIQIEAWRVMECLDADGKITMGELAKRALLNPPALSKLVDRMVSDGLSKARLASSHCSIRQHSASLLTGWCLTAWCTDRYRRLTSVKSICCSRRSVGCGCFKFVRMSRMRTAHSPACWKAVTVMS